MARNAQAESISLLLAGGLCLLPFLLPYHQLPLPSFQAEWLAVALGVCAMLATLLGRGAAFVPIPAPAKWLIAFALFLGAQALSGWPAYVQAPLLGALYVLYAALLIWLGAQLAANAGSERAAVVLAAALLIGALLNAAAGVIQFYGVPVALKDIVAEMQHDPRHNGAYGNIAQANLYANYLALGATALLFLWLRGSLRTAYALAAAMLLAWACALSGSRSALLYVLWFAGLGTLAGRMAGSEGRCLRYAAYGMAGAMLAAQLALPWLNQALHLGPASLGAFERLAELPEAQAGGRWQAWVLAGRAFADAPVSGVGIGGFAGAAFALGLAPEMALGEVWTSPHNLVLQLLAETGALGAFFALAAVCTWCWQAARRYFASPEPAMWWIIAAVGIELIHSMIEYPLWSAHFLGVIALVMGLGAPPEARARGASRYSLMTAVGICAALALALALSLRDYMRFDATRITGTSVTLASAADTARDTAVMRRLTNGLLGPTAELWIFVGAPLDRTELSGMIEISGRLAHYFPSNAVIVRRTVFLAFDGRAAEARGLLARALRSFPQRCKQTKAILTQAYAADRAAIEPLLNLSRNWKGCA